MTLMRRDQINGEKMSRAKELEDAGRKYFDLKNYEYISAKNQTVKCYKCGAFQQVRTQGFDFLIWHPKIAFAEFKTGAGVLSKSQKKLKATCERVGVPYIEVHDTIDDLMKVL